jgi:thiamine biosynthesis lipoprotein
VVSPDQSHAVHHLENVMGTVVTIDVYTDAGVSVDITPQLYRARAVLHDVDDVFSTWKENSPITKLRRGDIRMAEAPPEVAVVVDLCATARDLSGGWFDPWAMPGGFDPTGCVKGWAAQRALAALVAPGIFGAIVNAAGDIASFGGREGANSFRFGIVDPLSPGDLACIVEMTGALATSGTYERGEHLIDPRSGESSVRVASASVTGPDLGLADALATALAVAGDEGLARVETLDGYEALTISFGGAQHWTEHFPLASSSDGLPKPAASR